MAVDLAVHMADEPRGCHQASRGDLGNGCAEARPAGDRASHLRLRPAQRPLRAWQAAKLRLPGTGRTAGLSGPYTVVPEPQQEQWPVTGNGSIW